VVDVLRATSTIVRALAVGYRRVLCVETIERALALRTSDRVLAGERGGLPPPEFDFGNSPAAIEARGAEELVLATTNGSPTIVRAAAAADTVLIGALINLEAVLERVAEAAVGSRAHDQHVSCPFGDPLQHRLEVDQGADQHGVSSRGGAHDRR
jgi:2-phosphosulfolactate phosphatase